MQLQIKWKDTSKQNNDVTYRKCTIKRYKGGWIITGINPPDANIYHCIECAENAIDQLFISKPRKENSRRKAHGIHIIGEKESS